jgi:hypothetical protein
MGKPEKLTLVCDADGSIGVVLEFSDTDFEAYSMPDLALVGAFRQRRRPPKPSAPGRTSSDIERSAALWRKRPASEAEHEGSIPFARSSA